MHFDITFLTKEYPVFCMWLGVPKKKCACICNSKGISYRAVMDVYRDFGWLVYGG